MAPKEAMGIVETLNRKAVFSIESFDQRAAIEVAIMLRGELGKKLPKAGAQTWAKLKFDRQIVAIAKVSGASEIYSDDKDIEKLGKQVSIPVTRVSDLPLPPEHSQTEFMDELEEAPEEPSGNDE